MKKLLNAILNLFIKPKLEERKQALREKLEKEITETDSEWLKSAIRFILNFWIVPTANSWIS